MPFRPAEQEYAPYFARYIVRVPEDDILSVLRSQVEEINAAAKAVRADQEQFRYGPDKWSIREVFGHLTDAERIFGYRALCLSRRETAPLPAWDENAYVERSSYNACALADLAGELTMMRQANLMFLARLNDAEWTYTGTVSGKTISVRAIAYIVAGHVRHHFEILRTRYGIPLNAG